MLLFFLLLLSSTGARRRDGMYPPKLILADVEPSSVAETNKFGPGGYIWLSNELEL